MQETGNIIHFKLLLNSSNLVKKVFSLNWPTNAITTRTFLWLKEKKNRQIGSTTHHGSKIVKNIVIKFLREFIYRNKSKNIKELMH